MRIGSRRIEIADLPAMDANEDLRWYRPKSGGKPHAVHTLPRGSERARIISCGSSHSGVVGSLCPALHILVAYYAMIHQLLMQQS